MNAEAVGLGLAFVAIAVVYASVGQAGASGYIAAMALFGMAPIAMKTTALSLNVLVAAIGTFLFLRAKRISWRNIYPYALLGFPFSLVGGAVNLPSRIYYPIVGIILILSALQMARTALAGPGAHADTPTAPPFWAGLLVGAGIGFVSGTTGTGGGVFLAPVILSMNWATPHQTAATTAVYNLMNSAAALLGSLAYWNQLPASLPWWLLAVAIGGAAGAHAGSRYLSDRWLRAILAMLLLTSGLKLLFW